MDGDVSLVEIYDVIVITGEGRGTELEMDAPLPLLLMKANEGQEAMISSPPSTLPSLR